MCTCAFLQQLLWLLVRFSRPPPVADRLNINPREDIKVRASYKLPKCRVFILQTKHQTMSGAKRLREMVASKKRSGARNRAAVIADRMKESSVLEIIYPRLPDSVVAALEAEGFRTFAHGEDHYNCHSHPRPCVCTVVSARHVILNSNANLANDVALAVHQFIASTSSDYDANKIISIMTRRLRLEQEFLGRFSADTFEKLHAEGFTTAVKIKEPLRCTHAVCSFDPCESCSPKVFTTVSAHKSAKAN